MKSTQKIALLLALVFLLPALFFSVYELSSLDKDEKMIQEIYRKQLEAILFSVNQYSDDIVGTWTSTIENGVSNRPVADSIPPKVRELLSLNEAIRAVFVLDSSRNENAMELWLPDGSDDPLLRGKAASVLLDNPALIQQLITYRRSGFQKTQRLEFADSRNTGVHVLVFIARKNAQTFVTAGIVIDATLFIEDIVGPRLQSVARDQFVLSALVNGTDSVIYSTDAANNSTAAAEALTKDFWIFPQYALGIRTSGDTLQALVRERTRNNFLLLIGLDVVLITAVVLVFRNLKKEVDLAQNKADFVSNVSHEIRTPLALISMFAETLEMDRVPTEEKKKEYYRIITKESQRLTGIVNKILNFSQKEAKKKRLTPEPVHIKDEINGILSVYHFHLSNKGFSYTFNASDDVWVRADREAFVECIINLIDNAMKYSDDVKRIEIYTGLVGDFAYVAVRDYGRGIAKKDQRHVFDKFYRVPGGDLARSRGTGLGLALVKQLMDEQHGKVTVSSEPGKGSTFKLFFPIERHGKTED